MPTQTQEMFMVAFFMHDGYGEKCSWCEMPATIRIDATPNHLRDYACEDCAAGYMRSNAETLSAEEE